MQIDRLLAGAAVATLMATSAFAQSGSTPSSTTTPPAAAAGAQAGTDQSTAAPAAETIITPSPSSNILVELKSAGKFTTLLSLLYADGALGPLLASHPGLTLIAPTDAAFAALPPGQLDALKKDPAQLRALLTYHLIAAPVTEAQVKGHPAGKVATAGGKEVSIDGSGTPIKINDADVIQAAVPASNGLIYVVDKVLTPMA